MRSGYYKPASFPKVCSIPARGQHACTCLGGGSSTACRRCSGRRLHGRHGMEPWPGLGSSAVFLLSACRHVERCPASTGPIPISPPPLGPDARGRFLEVTWRALWRRQTRAARCADRPADAGADAICLAQCHCQRRRGWSARQASGCTRTCPAYSSAQQACFPAIQRRPPFRVCAAVAHSAASNVDHTPACLPACLPQFKKGDKVFALTPGFFNTTPDGAQRAEARAGLWRAISQPRWPSQLGDRRRVHWPVLRGCPAPQQ